MKAKAIFVILFSVILAACTPAVISTLLVAANLGLGTCWIAAFNVEAARSVLRLRADVDPVIFTPLGYPADQPSPKARKPLADLVRYEHW